MLPESQENLAPFGRYFLVRRIATGGMGEVFLAKSRGAAGFEKTVVIKRILPHLARNEEFVARFIAEGRLVVQLTHGNIVQVYDMGEVDGDFFIAMEYVDGLDLRELMRRADDVRRPFPVPLALEVIEELAAGLAYAHSRTGPDGRPLGLIHRDVSPANIMISRDGAVKLLDFGIAKTAAQLARSITGSLRGKFQYMSPEQARGEALDGRSDLFSVGIVAYELLTGQRPFDDASELRILDLVQTRVPEPIRTIAPDVPAQVAALVERLLEKRPEARFQTADELRRAIARVMMELGAVVTSEDLAELVRRREQQRPHAAEPLSLDQALALQLHEAIGTGPREGTRTAAADRAPVSDEARRPPVTPLTDRRDAPVTSTQQLLPTEAPQRLVLLLLVIAVAVLLYFNLRFVLQGDGVEEQATSRADAAAAVTAQATPGAAPVEEPVAPPEEPRPAPQPPKTAPLPRNAEPLSARAERRPAEILAVVAKSEAPPVPRPRAVTVRTVPKGAKVAIEGREPELSPLTVQVAPDRALRGTASMEGHEDVRFTLTAESPRTLTVTLPAAARGTVQFRFFPADSRVMMDGAPLSTGGSNVVRATLGKGRHELVVESKDGQTRTVRTFDLHEGEQKSLGTVELGTN